MRVKELKEYAACSNFHVLTPEEIESLHRYDSLFIDESDGLDEGYLKELEKELEEEKEKAVTLARKIQDAKGEKNANDLTDAVYVVLANAQTERDYLRLVGRYGCPTHRDIDSPMREYEALCEAIYRACAVLSYAANLGEYSDVQEVFSMENIPKLDADDPHDRYAMRFSLRIPDYRRAIYPNETTFNDANEFLLQQGRGPVFNPIRAHKHKTPDGRWFMCGIYSEQVASGLVEYKVTAWKEESALDGTCSDENKRFLARCFVQELINEQIRDVEFVVYDGELSLEDPYTGLEPPMWRLAWLALALAQGKEIPGICRTCGRIIDRRGERRCKTVSCNHGEHDCCSAFHNNGKTRMCKRGQWGRPFKEDSTFSYIDDYRDAVAEVSLT